MKGENFPTLIFYIQASGMKLDSVNLIFCVYQCWWIIYENQQQWEVVVEAGNFLKRQQVLICLEFYERTALSHDIWIHATYFGFVSLWPPTLSKCGSQKN